MAASTPVVIASNQTTLPADVTDRVARELGRVSASDILYVSENFATTSNVLANARPIAGDMNVRNYKTKTIFVRNTSANNGSYSIVASIDNGVTFDVPIITNININAGVTAVTNTEFAHTNLRILVRSNTNGQSTTYTTKAYGIGV
jgi:hypothetical protein